MTLSFYIILLHYYFHGYTTLIEISYYIITVHYQITLLDCIIMLHQCVTLLYYNFILHYHITLLYYIITSHHSITWLVYFLLILRFHTTLSHRTFSFRCYITLLYHIIISYGYIPLSIPTPIYPLTTSNNSPTKANKHWNTVFLVAMSRNSPQYNHHQWFCTPILKHPQF